jgi:signal peptidase I
MADEANNATLPPGAAKGPIRDNLEVLCFAMVLILFFKTFVGQQFKIPSASMRNTLMIGDHLLADKFIFAQPQWSWEAKLFPMRPVRRGDIIVFRYPQDRDQDWVKRCVALPGDTVEVRDRRLYINGRQLTGPWEFHIPVPHYETEPDGRPVMTDDPIPGPWPPSRDIGPSTPAPGPWPHTDPHELTMDRQGIDSLVLDGFKDNMGPVTVPPGCIFAMGDNRDNSEDSRYWGFLPIDHLRGRPFIVWWSFREGEHDYDNGRVPNGPMDVIQDFVDAARHFFTRTRWERSGLIPR